MGFFEYKQKEAMQNQMKYSILMTSKGFKLLTWL